MGLVSIGVFALCESSRSEMNGKTADGGDGGSIYI